MGRGVRNHANPLLTTSAIRGIAARFCVSETPGGMAGKSRRHGFESPLDTRQVASWFAYGLFLAAFFILYTPVHTDAAGVVLTSLYALFAVSTFCTAAQAMRVDPSDQGSLAKRTGTAVLAPAAATERKNYCYHCEAYVNLRSKHCRRSTE